MRLGTFSFDPQTSLLLAGATVGSAQQLSTRVDIGRALKLVQVRVFALCP